MNHKELSRRMGEYNPKQSHHSRMTKMGIILAKDRKATVQRELDEKINSSIAMDKKNHMAKKMKSYSGHYQMNKGGQVHQLSQKTAEKKRMNTYK